MSNIDTNVDNYTISELLAILDLDDSSTEESIEEKTNKYIDKFDSEGNQTMSDFFYDIQQKLLGYTGEAEADNEDEEEKVAKQTDEWFENENLKQNDSSQNNKVTDRKQKIDVYEGNEHNPMNQEQLGVTNTVSVPFAQDSLNPTLKNTTERFIVLDSQYRQTGEISTDYTLDLSEHLKDVLNLRLFSFQIPVTWYVIDVEYGNTCFWINDASWNIDVNISIESGNYTSSSLVTALNNAIYAAGFTKTSVPNWAPVTYDQTNGKITINLYGAKYIDPDNPSITFTINETNQIIFFDFTAKLNCANKCSNIGIYINQTLGWVMGFRSPTVFVNPSGNTADAILSLSGPKYLILVIDDYNQNHINNGLVSITELSKTLKMPTYYSPDLPYICVGQQNTTTTTNTSSFDKYSVNFGSYPQLVPSAPRTLTQSQIYTINEIIKNNDQNTSYRIKAPTTTDVFAVIPVKGGLSLGDIYTEMSGSLQDFKRSYFGPVDIDRMRIKLLDDKGNVLNLNGCDWSITLISENLYQY